MKKSKRTAGQWAICSSGKREILSRRIRRTFDSREDAVAYLEAKQSGPHRLRWLGKNFYIVDLNDPFRPINVA